MAVSFKGVESAVTGTRATLTSLLGLSREIFISHLVARAGIANTGVINVGGSDVAAGAARWGYLQAEESITISTEVGFVSSDNIYFIATVPGDTIHIVYLH